MSESGDIRVRGLLDEDGLRLTSRLADSIDYGTDDVVDWSLSSDPDMRAVEVWYPLSGGLVVNLTGSGGRVHHQPELLVTTDELARWAVALIRGHLSLLRDERGRDVTD